MNISRRWFIGGVTLGAMQGCRMITDPAGLFRGDGANVKFGVISDVHVIASDTDRGTCGNTRTLEHTLKWFDAQGVDAVMVAGDIADAGLVHYSLVDERSLWQGAFTSLGTVSLRYAGTPDEEFPGEGYENTGGGKEKDGEKTMERTRRSNARNGLLVSVYDDCTVFRRRDFRHDADLGPDWVLPHASAEAKPFAFASRAVKSTAPQFDPAAVVTAEHGRAFTRNAKKNLPPKADKAEQEKAKLPTLNVTFPAVKRTFKTIAWRYEVTAEREDGSAAAKKRILAGDFHLPAGSQKKSYTISFLRSQLPASGKIRFSVMPYDCFGNAGRALASKIITL